MRAEETEHSSSGIVAKSGRVSDRAWSGYGRPHGVRLREHTLGHTPVLNGTLEASSAVLSSGSNQLTSGDGLEEGSTCLVAEVHGTADRDEHARRMHMRVACVRDVPCTGVHPSLTLLCLFAYAGGRCLEVVHGTGRQAMQTATQRQLRCGTWRPSGLRLARQAMQTATQ